MLQMLKHSTYKTKKTEMNSICLRDFSGTQELKNDQGTDAMNCSAQVNSKHT